MSRNENRVDTTFKWFNLTVAYDDDVTRVRVWINEPLQGDISVAEGKAKRRKGDPRDPKLGLALATGRAFEALAKREFDFVKSKLGEDVE
jgi:hypothetical protein